MPGGNGGKFTSEARGIYELVLEMQKVLNLSMIEDLRRKIRSFFSLGFFLDSSSEAALG
jgi:hypothetical protein